MWLSHYLVFLNITVLGIQLGILGSYSWKICDCVHLSCLTMFQQSYGLAVCRHGPKSHSVVGVRLRMQFIWWPEECTAGTDYLSRILWLDKELLEKLCCVAFFIYWFVVRNRCLTDSCGYISECGDYWSLAECFLILLNIPVLKIAVPHYPTGQRGALGHPQKCHSPSSLSTHKMPTEALCAALAETIRSWCSVTRVWCGAEVCSWGEDRVLLWAEGCGAAMAWTIGLQELHLVQSFKIFSPGGKWAGWVPARGYLELEDFAGKDESFNNRMERWWQNTVIIVGTESQKQTRDLHSRNNDLTVTNGEDDRWMRDLGSDVGGEQQGYSSRKLSQLPTPAQSRHRVNHIHSTVSSPISLWHSHALTCKPCSCCQFSGFGCHIWSQWMARWWHRFLPWLLCWPCPGSRAGSQLWPWLSKSSEKETRAKRTLWILCE